MLFRINSACLVIRTDRLEALKVCIFTYFEVDPESCIPLSSKELAVSPCLIT